MVIQTKIREDLKSKDEVIISIDRKQTLEEFFGKGKGKKIDVQKMKDEGRTIWRMD